MDSRESPPTGASTPAPPGTRWGVRFFAVVVARLPPSMPPTERQLLRTVYTIHRMIDSAAGGLTDGIVWKLVVAIDALTATADDARAAGVNGDRVGQLVAMTVAAAHEILYLGTAHLSPQDAMNE